MTTNNPIIIKKILNESLDQTHWSNLQRIIKQLQQYMKKSSSNRQYIEAQKAADKIAQATEQLKKRQVSTVQNKMNKAVQQLEHKHNQEITLLERQWNYRIQQVDRQWQFDISQKRERHSEQLQKARNQMELAIPTVHSPDNQLHKLRWQEEHYAKQMKFMQAQRVKQKIEQRERDLSQKHAKFRQNNIRQMLKEIYDKQESQIAFLQQKQRDRIEDLKKEKNKKLKDLKQKQLKELKQAKWIYGEQMKRFY